VGTPSGSASSRSAFAGKSRYTLAFTFPGHANRREGILKYVKRRDSVGGLNLNTGSNVLVWLSGENFRDGDFFPPIASFPTRIYLLRNATYRISYSVNALSAGAVAAGSVKTFVAKNGSGNMLAGSMSGFNVPVTASAHGAAFSSFIVDLNSGDYIEIYAIREGAPAGAINTIQNGSFMQVEVVSYPDETVLGGKQVIAVPSVLEKATITKGVSGYSGTTSVRILKNGLSVMGSNDMLITSAQQFVEYTQSYFGSTSFEVGDVVSLDVISEEAPYPRDLAVILRMAAVNG